MTGKKVKNARKFDSVFLVECDDTDRHPGFFPGNIKKIKKFTSNVRNV